MFGCFRSPKERGQARTNREIQKMLEQERKKRMENSNVPLQPKPRLQPCNPGTGESGKSTFIKQMKIITGNGYSKGELVNYKGLVCSNIFTAMQSLLTGMSALELSFQGEECKVSSPVRVQVIRYLNMALTSHPSFNSNFKS